MTEYYKRLNAITEYELAQLKEQYTTLMDTVDRAHAVIVASQREIDLMTYVAALTAKGVHMTVEYQDQQISYDMMLGMMLDACKRAWVEVEDE
jgi:hypothetical protein